VQWGLMASHTRKSERWGHGNNETGRWVKWQSNQERGGTTVVPEYSRGVPVATVESGESLPADLLRGLAGGAFWAVGACFTDRTGTMARRTGQECLE